MGEDNDLAHSETHPGPVKRFDVKFMRLLVIELILVFIFTGSSSPQRRRPTRQTPTANPAPAATDTASAQSTSFSSKKIPDVRISDQNGKQLNFYSDLVKGKTVAINFIFTTCTNICPPLTATFRRVQQNAIERNIDVHLITISVDPTIDTPERLHAFAEKFKAGPGWTFVTGDKTQIDSLLKGFGVAVDDKNTHTSMIMVGNDKVDYWTTAYGLSSPSSLVDLIVGATARN